MNTHMQTRALRSIVHLPPSHHMSRQGSHSMDMYRCYQLVMSRREAVGCWEEVLTRVKDKGVADIKVGAAEVVGRETAAVEMETAAVERETVAVEMETAAVEMGTAAVELETAAVEMVAVQEGEMEEEEDCTQMCTHLQFQ